MMAALTRHQCYNALRMRVGSRKGSHSHERADV